MKLSLHAGPVHAPALRASGTQAAAAHVAPRRRPIGEGAREIVVSDPASVARPRRRARTRPELAARSRRRTPLFATLLCAFAASAAALGIGAAVDAPRSLMSREDFQDARRGVEAATRGALAECRTQDGVAREICRARARGDERVKMAELQARYEGTVSAAGQVEVARARAQHDVARARCVALSSGERVGCLRAAREAWTRETNRAKVASAT